MFRLLREAKYNTSEWPEKFIIFPSGKILVAEKDMHHDDALIDYLKSIGINPYDEDVKTELYFTDTIRVRWANWGDSYGWTAYNENEGPISRKQYRLLKLFLEDLVLYGYKDHEFGLSIGRYEYEGSVAKILDLLIDMRQTIVGDTLLKA